MSDSVPTPPKSDAASRGFLRENIEAFAVAVAMALVIRHFCVEAFRIPTGSMMPSLYGDSEPGDLVRRQGDRILVDKLVYLRRDPRRFEVVVFKYPLDRSRNFIKRLVGLPNEILRIAGGDIWTSRDQRKTWTLQRKPSDVREELLTEFYPNPRDPDPREASPFTVKNWTQRPKGGWEVNEKDRVFQVSASGVAELVFAHDVRAYAYGGFDGQPIVGDVRVRFSLEVHEPGTLGILLEEWALPHACELGAKSSEIRTGQRNGPRKDVDFTLEAGETYEISFSNVDDLLRLVVDGRSFELPFVSFESPEEIAAREAIGTTRTKIAFVARGLKATLRNVAIDRDVFYRDGGQSKDGDAVDWTIPDGHYFMLGDNSASSSDSRRWQVARVVLNDGRVVEWEPNARNPSTSFMSAFTDHEIVVNADVEGLVVRFRKSDVKEVTDNYVGKPFVARGHLIGRAFTVFWPIFLPPAYSGPTRVKWIR